MRKSKKVTRSVTKTGWCHNCKGYRKLTDGVPQITRKNGAAVSVGKCSECKGEAYRIYGTGKES